MMINSKNIFTVVIPVLFLLSFSLCFVSGTVNPNIKVEQTAEYVADIAKNHTVNGKYAGLLVAPNERTNKQLIDTSLELYDLYGAFTENIASYAGTVNADHLYDVRFKDIDTDNLSYLYTTSGTHSVEYHDHYKHAYYPLELMFESVPDQESWGHPRFQSLLYISQSQADKFLDLSNLEHTEENYKSLLKTRIFLTTNGVEKEWQIEDIYLEQNYFYDAVSECAGEFVFAWSSDAFLQGPKKQSLYFLSSYSFRNSFYFSYATSLYPQTDFDYKINDYNFVGGYKVDSTRLVFSVNTQDSIGSAIFLTLGIAFSLLGLCYIYFSFNRIKWWHHPLFIVSMIVPYLLFKLLYLLTKNVALFSSFSTMANMIMLLCVVSSYTIIVLIRKKKKDAIN